MQVREIMTADPVVVDTGTTIRDASAIMRKNDIGLILVRRGGSLEGIVTDRDIVVRAIGAGLDPAVTPVGGIITNRLVTCFEDQSIEAAADIMKQNQVRRLVVLNRDEQPAGVVSLTEIAAQGALAQTLEAIEKVTAR